MKSSLSVVPLALTTFVCAMSAISCGQDGGDGIKPEVNKEVGDISASAKSAGGDYSKLSDADKQKVLQLAHGSETQAKALVSQMAFSPRAMNAGKAGTPPSGN